jgi:hypothetical protein
MLPGGQITQIGNRPIEKLQIGDQAWLQPARDFAPTALRFIEDDYTSRKHLCPTVSMRGMI